MMNSEEFERRMEFIVNHQARFDANIQELQEVQKANDETLGRMLEGLEGTKEIATQTAENLAQLTGLTREGFTNTLDTFKVIGEKFEAIAENSKNTDAKIDALVDSQIQTEEMIRRVDSKINRHLKDDHNSP